MILFSPLGSPIQDATFTATGDGAPTAEISATTVNPSTTAGLSQSAQDANASSQQDDFWASFASGGNGGLTQLADGVGKMVTGLAALCARRTPARRRHQGRRCRRHPARQRHRSRAQGIEGPQQGHRPDPRWPGPAGRRLPAPQGGLASSAGRRAVCRCRGSGLDAIDQVSAIIAGVGVRRPPRPSVRHNAPTGSSALIAGFSRSGGRDLAGLTCSRGSDERDPSLRRPPGTPDPCYHRVRSRPSRVTAVATRSASGRSTSTGLLPASTGPTTPVAPASRSPRRRSRLDAGPRSPGHAWSH